jgi:DinB superfamily
MQAKDVIRQSIDTTDMVFGKYLEDLDDQAFLMHPLSGMNHIAWQLGHLISSEHEVLEAIKPGCCPPLPEGFAAKYTKETATSDDPKAFQTKAEFLALWKAQHEAIKAVVETLSDADLDAPAPERIRSFCPTVGHALNMMAGIHPMMHAGQFVAVRRALNKPIAF